MSSSRWISLLAAVLVAASACSDSTAPVSKTGASAPVGPVVDVLYGTISRTGRDPLHGLVLTREDGTAIPLSISAETSTLSTLDGAGVEVRGIWDTDQSFEVDAFVVRRINGNVVFDGVLVEDRTQDASDNPLISYSFQLTDGSSSPAINPSPEMLTHRAARMWVRLDDAGNVAEFGVIAG